MYNLLSAAASAAVNRSTTVLLRAIRNGRARLSAREMILPVLILANLLGAVLAHVPFSVLTLACALILAGVWIGRYSY